MKYITNVEGKQFLVEIIDDKHVSVDGKVYEVDFESVSGQPVYSLIVDGRSHEYGHRYRYCEGTDPCGARQDVELQTGGCTV